MARISPRGYNFACISRNSEIARLDVKKPLTRLATLATLSPRERAVDELGSQPSPLGRGWSAAGAFISRSGPGEGSVPKNLNARSVLQPVNPGNSDSANWPVSVKVDLGIRAKPKIEDITQTILVGRNALRLRGGSLPTDHQR